MSEQLKELLRALLTVVKKEKGKGNEINQYDSVTDARGGQRR